MEATTTYTEEQLKIVHKLTVFKYDPTDESKLITSDEYNKLDTFLKGYAYCIQADHPKSQIPAGKIRSQLFFDGIEQAKKELLLK